jgi:fructose-1,6-bisphosphatase/inositol monophosphatase family enzyme
MPLPARSELEALVTRAGAIALGHFRHAAAERKADRTLVTAADRDVEAYLVGELGRLFPEAGIVGEEGAARAGEGRWRVAIDPVDGTAAFVAGLPTWCVCLGVLDGGVPVAGAVHVPCSAETYVAADGAAWWNGMRLPPLDDRPVAGDRFVLAHAKAHRRHRFTYAGKVRSLGSTAYHVALVARGAAEGALLGHARIWDLAAPGAVLYAVGGRYEYLGGGAVDLATLADGRPAPDFVLAAPAGTLATLRPQLGGA